MALCNISATTTIKTVIFVELLQSSIGKIGPNLSQTYTVRAVTQMG